MRLIDHENLFGDLVFSELLHALSRLLNFEYEDEPCLQNVRIYNWLRILQCWLVFATGRARRPLSPGTIPNLNPLPRLAMATAFGKLVIGLD